MPTEDTPDHTPVKPLKDHQFETPVVHESRSSDLPPHEPHPSADADSDRLTATRRPAAERSTAM